MVEHTLLTAAGCFIGAAPEFDRGFSTPRRRLQAIFETSR